MTIHMGGVTIDCADPRELAKFWTGALGEPIGGDHDGEFVFIGLPGGKSGYLGLQKVAEPRTGKNRVHLDFSTGDRAAEVARLVALGATATGEHSVPGLTWTVLEDPEGNVFCVGSENG